MNKKVLLFLTTIFLVSSAQANIYDRIDKCQQVGGGPCVFDLLRGLVNEESFQQQAPLKPGLFKTEGREWYSRVTVQLTPSEDFVEWVMTQTYGPTRATPYGPDSTKCTGDNCGAGLVKNITRTSFERGSYTYKWIAP